MPSRTTRSGRTVKHSSTSQSKMDALELLERQRRGEKVENAVKEDEPLFEEVNEEEYKRTRKSKFVVDADSEDELDDSDLDFIDDDDDFDDERPGPSKRGKDDRKLKPKERGFGFKPPSEVDPRQRSMKSFLGVGKPKKRPSASAPSADPTDQPDLDQDDILSQMLFEVHENPNSVVQRPPKLQPSKLNIVAPVANSRPNVVRPIKTKATYDTTPSKRQRTESPGPCYDAGALDNWQEDDFDDEVDNKQSIKQEPESTHIENVDVKPDTKPKIESIDIEDFDDEDEQTPEDTGIEVVPLNDDLKSNLEFHDTVDGKKYTRVYWYDCCEDLVRSPGIVYLFGRIYATSAKRFVSCCTIVKSIKRTCYLLIADDCSYDDVVGEFTNITAKRFKIKNFTCEKVTKKYAFSKNPKTPLIADYVKVDYPASMLALPGDLVGQTFTSVLNVNQSPMEKLILELKLRGPCWLRLIEPVAPNSQITWSRIELILESLDNLVVENDSTELKAPYFCTLSLSLRTYPNPVTHHNEIIAIAGMVNTAFNLDQCLKSTNKASGHFVVMTKPSAGHKELHLPYDFGKAMAKYKKTRFELVESERELLLSFMDKFNNLDPDIVVGHDLMNFDYETLVMRMKCNKVGVWSKLGRFKRTELPSTKAAFRYMFSGRVMCDIRTSAMELIRARSYDLTELASHVLKRTRVEYHHDEIVESYKTSESLFKMLDATWNDNDSIFSILVELNVIPLALKITNITGNILSRTLAAGRSERNEYLLLHAFHEDNFICPEKQVSKYQRKQQAANNDTKENADEKDLGPARKKAAYSGGLVLEPKAGFYDTCILLMDFNSLYPSIIQEFNICFSTVKRPELALATKSDQTAALAEGHNPAAAAAAVGSGELIADVPDESAPTGVLAAQLRNLVDRRRQVKRLLSDTKAPEQRVMLDIEQKALKLTANSMYGCLGFEQSRFYAKHLAALVTFKGREILMSTKALVERLGYEVIYGDTDSLMINTKTLDYDEVLAKGGAIKSEINRTFKLLEIDIDGVFRPLLLLKKKNYAGTSLKRLPDGQFAKTMETKGIDTVRRDRAVVAKEAGERVLSMVLGAEKDIVQVLEDVHNYLRQLADQVRAGSLANEQFLISKQLNRNPDEYRDTKGIGHVTLALRYNRDSKHSRKLKAGDTIEYVICEDASGESANQRAYTLAELTAEGSQLKLDTEYYLCQQIHPVITRICDKLPTTNAYVIAEMLGVEKSGQLHIKRDDSDLVKRDQLISRGEARFHSCKPLVIVCPNCNLADEIKSRSRRNRKHGRQELSLTTCVQCGVRYAMRAKLVVAQLLSQLRQLHLDLFNAKFVCENNECDYTSRNAFCRLTSGAGPDEAASGAQAPVCELCASPMAADMDDRKMDLQLNYLKHLFDAQRELDQAAGGEPLPEDVSEMYGACQREIEYALRCSLINNIDAHAMFSMVCSA